VPEKYVLSARACLGILRRSDKRGKPLTAILRETLMIQAGIHPSPSRSEADVTGGGKGALTQIDLSATLATNNDQYLFQPIENHAQDGRYVLREDGVIQTLMARMGTGGGNVPLILQSSSEKSEEGPSLETK